MKEGTWFTLYCIMIIFGLLLGDYFIEFRYATIAVLVTQFFRFLRDIRDNLKGGLKDEDNKKD